MVLQFKVILSVLFTIIISDSIFYHHSFGYRFLFF